MPIGKKNLVVPEDTDKLLKLKILEQSSTIRRIGIIRML